MIEATLESWHSRAVRVVVEGVGVSSVYDTLYIVLLVVRAMK